MRPLRSLVRVFHTAALDLLYPPGCAACDEPVDRACFCLPCGESLLELERPCPRCALPLDEGLGCAACLGHPTGLDEAHAAFAFGGALADALRLLKFGTRVDLGERLGTLLAPALSSVLARRPEALVVPVPLARARLRTRGYNQAALLALGAVEAASPSRLVRTDLLMRTRDTPQQVGRSALLRRAALHGAFRATAEVHGRDIVLIDDVMTTGATLAACTAALRDGGARQVVALTVGRALP